jgi:serine-type D-Ala-D-Ala carboxypeptidase/endopeptidase (penicillin-binding protein 4)
MRKWIMVLLALISTTSFAQPWRQGINDLLHNELNNAEVGIMVRDAKTGAMLYEHNAYKAFTPASNMKLFTAAAALDDLGANFQFHTTVHYNPKQLKQHSLRGNVYFKFTGDPSLRVRNLKQMVAKLHQQGVHQIHGKVVVDSSRFLPPNHAPGWTYDSLHWAFSAPISAVILNENKVSLKFEPSKTTGGQVNIIPGRDMAYMKLQHSISTVSYQYSMKNCSLLLHVSRRNRISLGGCWPSEARGWKSFAVQNPPLYAENIIKATLKKNHIRLYGHVVSGITPKHSKVMINHSSKKLKTLLLRMMKNSDNVYAESLNKTLGYVGTGRGSFLEGVNTIKKVLARLSNIDFERTTIVDGSGQSRYDLLTPDQITRLLYVMTRDTRWFKTYYHVLPVGGVDGTLRYRFTSEDMRKRVHAKTGSMSGVSALSGYMTAGSGRRLVFSILINHVVGSIKQGRALEDQICQTLYQV